MTKTAGTPNENKKAEKTVVSLTKPSGSVSSTKKMYFKYSLLMMVFIVSLLLSVYTVSSYSKITEVNVEGTVSVYDQLVYESSQIAPGDSLIKTLFNKTSIEEAVVDTNVQVSAAELHVTGLQSVTLTVEEYDAVAFLFEEGTYYKILENGKILDDRFPRITDNQPILIGFEQGRVLNRMLDEYEEVDDNVRQMIAEIEKLDSDRNEMLIRISLTDGNEALASIPSFAERINYYPQMRETVDGEQGLFDLEAGAFFIPYHSDEYLEEYEEIDSEGNGIENEEDSD